MPPESPWHTNPAHLFTAMIPGERCTTFCSNFRAVTVSFPPTNTIVPATAHREGTGQLYYTVTSGYRCTTKTVADRLTLAHTHTPLFRSVILCWPHPHPHLHHSAPKVPATRIGTAVHGGTLNRTVAHSH